MDKATSKQYGRELQKAINGGVAPTRKRASNQELREFFGSSARG